MKTTIFIAVLLGSSVLLNAQNDVYTPLVNEEVSWSYCDVVKAGNNDYVLTYTQFKFDGDTIVNDLTYKKLFRRDCSSNVLSYLASMREENKKVYAVYSGKQQEQLIYHFGLVAGDSIQSPYDDKVYYHVIKADSIELASGKRRRIELDFDTWIEGIGTLDRFMMYPLQALPLYDLGIRINYQKQGGTFSYKTSEWYLNENDCNFSSVEEPEFANTTVYFITPALLSVQTELADPACTIELLDVCGKKLVQKNTGKMNTTIDVSRFPDGLYILRLYRNGELSFTRKINKKS